MQQIIQLLLSLSLGFAAARAIAEYPNSLMRGPRCTPPPSGSYRNLDADRAPQGPKRTLPPTTVTCSGPPGVTQPGVRIRRASDLDGGGHHDSADVAPNNMFWTTRGDPAGCPNSPCE
ncbi:hypothetical protein FB451DRAFT_1190210 [Mycena latifolia]|nr:hypothetical protein FB451DRAFT_1190210 [Mycena latifolia]